MPNEIRITVKVYGDESGFQKAKDDAHKTAADIEGEFKKSGQRAGDNLGEGVSSGIRRGTDQARDEFGRFVASGSSPGEKVRENVSGGLRKGVLQGITAAGPIISTGIAAAAPIIGAAASAAIIGGGAGIGVIGGVLLAARDPRVSKAGSDMGANLMKGLTEDSKSFIGPVLASIKTVGEGFDTLRPRLKRIFENSSQFVKPLTDGVISGLNGITRGVDKMVANSEPVVTGFSNVMAGLGDATGDAFEVIAGGSDDAGKALADLTEIVGDLILGLGVIIRALTETYGAMSDLGDEINSGVRDFFGITTEVKKYGETVEMVRHNVNGMTDATNDQIGALKELADQIKAQSDPLFALIKGQRDVEKAQSKYNEAVRKGGRESDAAKDALADMGQAALGMTGKVAAAAGKFDGQLTPAMRRTLVNAGLNRTQIAALEKQLKSAAKAADNWSGTFTQTFVTRSITGKEVLSSTGHRVGGYSASGGIIGAATGGGHDGLRWVGEHGPELVDLPAGTSVKSNPDSMRMASGGGMSGSGPIQIILKFDPSGAPEAIQGLLTALRGEIRGQGGNVQQVLG